LPQETPQSLRSEVLDEKSTESGMIHHKARYRHYERWSRNTNVIRIKLGVT
jgi:hypothetical protein